MFIIVKKPARFMSIPDAHTQLPKPPDSTDQTDERISAISSNSERAPSPLDLTVTSTTPNQENFNLNASDECSCSCPKDNSVKDNHVEPSKQVSSAIKSKNLKNKSSISKKSRLFAKFLKFLKKNPGLRRKRRILRRKLITISTETPNELINNNGALDESNCQSNKMISPDSSCLPTDLVGSGQQSQTEANKNHSRNSNKKVTSLIKSSQTPINDTHKEYSQDLKESNNEANKDSNCITTSLPGSLHQFRNETNKENSQYSSYNHERLFQGLQEFNNDALQTSINTTNEEVFRDSNYNSTHSRENLQELHIGTNKKSSLDFNLHSSINDSNKEYCQYSGYNNTRLRANLQKSNNEANIKLSNQSNYKADNRKYSPDSSYNSILDILQSFNNEVTNEIHKEYSLDSSYIPTRLVTNNEANKGSSYDTNAIATSLYEDISEDSNYNPTRLLDGLQESSDGANEELSQDFNCIVTSLSDRNGTNKEYSGNSSYIPSLKESNNEANKESSLYSNCIVTASPDSFQTSRNGNVPEDANYNPTRLLDDFQESSDITTSLPDSFRTSRNEINKKYSRDSSCLEESNNEANKESLHYSNRGSESIPENSIYNPTRLLKESSRDSKCIAKSSPGSLKTSKNDKIKEYSSYHSIHLHDNLPKSNNEASQDSDRIPTSLRSLQISRDMRNKEKSQDSNNGTNKEPARNSNCTSTSSSARKNPKEIFLKRKSNKEIDPCSDESNKESLRAQNETPNNEQPLPDSSENVKKPNGIFGNDEPNKNTEINSENSINKYLEKLLTSFCNAINDTKNKLNLIMAAQNLVGDHKQILDNFASELHSRNIDYLRLICRFSEDSREANDSKIIEEDSENFTTQDFDKNNSKVRNETEEKNNSHVISSSKNIPTNHNQVEKDDNLDNNNSKESAVILSEKSNSLKVVSGPLEANDNKERVEEKVKDSTSQSTEQVIKQSNKETELKHKCKFADNQNKKTNTQNGDFTGSDVEQLKKYISTHQPSKDSNGSPTSSQCGTDGIKQDECEGATVHNLDQNDSSASTVETLNAKELKRRSELVKAQNKMRTSKQNRHHTNYFPTKHKQTVDEFMLECHPEYVDPLLFDQELSKRVEEEDEVVHKNYVGIFKERNELNDNKHKQLKRPSVLVKAQNKTRITADIKRLKKDSLAIPTNHKQTINEFLLECNPEYVDLLPFVQELSKQVEEKHEGAPIQKPYNDLDENNVNKSATIPKNPENVDHLPQINQHTKCSNSLRTESVYNSQGSTVVHKTSEEKCNETQDLSSKNGKNNANPINPGQLSKGSNSTQGTKEPLEGTNYIKQVEEWCKDTATQKFFYNSNKNNNNNNENKTKQNKYHKVVEAASTERTPFTDVVGSIINNSNQIPVIQTNKTAKVATPSPRNYLYDRNTFLPIFRRRMLKNPSPCQTPSPQPTYSFLNETTNVTIPFRRAPSDRHPMSWKKPGRHKSLDLTKSSGGNLGINGIPIADIKLKCKEIQNRDKKVQKMLTDQRNIYANLEEIENRTTNQRNNCTQFKEKNEKRIRPKVNRKNSTNSKDMECGIRELQNRCTNLNQTQQSGEGFGILPTTTLPEKIPDRLQGPVYGPMFPPYGLTTANPDFRLNSLERVPDNQLMFPNIQKTFKNLQLQYLALHHNSFVPPGNGMNSCPNFNDPRSTKRDQRLKANQNAIQHNLKFPQDNNLLLPNTQTPFLATHSTHPHYVTLNKCAQERNLSVPPSNNNTHLNINGTVHLPQDIIHGVHPIAPAACLGLAPHEYAKYRNSRYNSGTVSVVNDASTINVLQQSKLPGNTQTEISQNINTLGTSKAYLPTNQVISQNNIITNGRQHNVIFPIKPKAPIDPHATCKQKEKVVTPADNIHIYSNGNDQFVPYARNEHSYMGIKDPQYSDLSRTGQMSSVCNASYSHGIDKILKGCISANQDTTQQNKTEDKLILPNVPKVLWMKYLDLKQCAEFKNMRVNNQIVPTTNNVDTTSYSSSSDAQAESIKDLPPSITSESLRSFRKRTHSSRYREPSKTRNKRPRLRLRISKWGAKFRSQLL